MALNLDALIRLLVLVGLGIACALILQPFAEILLWAGLLAVILKPLQLWLQHHLRLGRWWSAGLIMLAGLLVLLGPVGALAAALLNNVSELVELVQHSRHALPQSPPLLVGIPVLGPALQPLWHGLISDLHGLLRSHSATLTALLTRLLETSLAQGLGFLRLLVSLVVAALMLVSVGRRRPAGKYWQALSGQWAATVASLLPLLTLFGSFPLVSPLANAVGIPLVSVLLTVDAVPAVTMMSRWASRRPVISTVCLALTMMSA